MPNLAEQFRDHLIVMRAGAARFGLVVQSSQALSDESLFPMRYRRVRHPALCGNLAGW